MEADLLSRINKLKQDLTSVNTHNPKKSEDLAAYLSQSFKKSSSPDIQPTTTPTHYKAILDEKQARITELEEEVNYLRENSENQILDNSFIGLKHNNISHRYYETLF